MREASTISCTPTSVVGVLPTEILRTHPIINFPSKRLRITYLSWISSTLLLNHHAVQRFCIMPSGPRITFMSDISRLIKNRYPKELVQNHPSMFDSGGRILLLVVTLIFFFWWRNRFYRKMQRNDDKETYCGEDGSGTVPREKDLAFDLNLRALFQNY